MKTEGKLFYESLLEENKDKFEECLWKGVYRELNYSYHRPEVIIRKIGINVVIYFSVGDFNKDSKPLYIATRLKEKFYDTGFKTISFDKLSIPMKFIKNPNEENDFFQILIEKLKEWNENEQQYLEQYRFKECLI